MPVLVHLAREDAANRLVRRGIRSRRGVYCMPVLPDYFISHQWLRELKRGGARTLVAIQFRLPDDEPVLVGHYGQPHQPMALGGAIRAIREAGDARGFEIIVPRAIEPAEILRVRAVSRVVGWRFSPDAKGKRPFCSCRSCNRGEIKAGRRWREGDPIVRPPGMPELLRRLRAATDAAALEETLYRFDRKWRRDAAALEFLMERPEPRVLEALIVALASFRGPAARSMLARLAAHPDAGVARAARDELATAAADPSSANDGR